MCTQKRMDTTSSDECGICTGRVILPFLAGVVMGTGLSLLYAPKTGKELRGKIGDITDDAVDMVKNYATEAQEKISSTIEDSKTVIKEKMAVLTSAIEAGKEAMELEKQKYRDKET